MTSHTSAAQDTRGYVLSCILAFVERVKRMGVKLGLTRGPWHTAEQRYPTPNASQVEIVPVVTNGRTAMMVDTMEHAIDIAGLLNWCGIKQLNPVAALRLHQPVPH